MTTHVLRPVRESDLPHLQKLAAAVEGGLTTLPNDPQFLESKIIESIRAFDPRVRKAAGEHYLFALEEVATGNVVGTSGIIACVGGFEPFYSYEIRRESFSHEPLGISKEVRVLHLKRSHKGPSEVCSLFLDPGHRSGGLGRLLSLARFLFMAAYPKRFDAHVIAELRGWLDEKGRSPFWESVGRHFFEWDYTTADFLSGLGNKAFIEDLMPEYPIYLSLLPADVQAVIGQVHRETEPALKLLLAEGFQQTDEVDIFDAGPLLRAPLASLRTVKQSRVATAQVIPTADAAGDDRRMLVSNRAIDFRACLGSVTENNDGTVSVSAELADALRIATGDAVAFVHARPQSDTT